jgi:hypothetical protein
MSHWQTIESAPKDTAVLVYGSSYEVGHFNTVIGAWVSCWDHRRLHHVAWWQPLPEPPADRLVSTPESE